MILEKQPEKIRCIYNDDPDTVLEDHYHNLHEIIFPIEGSAYFSINKKKYLAEKGSILFISNFENHSMKVKSHPYKRYILSLTSDFLKTAAAEPHLTSILKNRPSGFCHLIKPGIKNKQILNDIFKKMNDEYLKKDIFWERILSSYLSSFLILLYRENCRLFPFKTTGKPDMIIYNIQKHIEENFIYDIKLKETADLFYINEYYLSHLFKKVTGYNFKEYVILQKLSYAKTLLVNSKDNITKVCTDSGFNNVNHFIRIFKKYQNTTPYQYRKKWMNI